MDQPKDLTTSETRPSTPPDVRISVTNFGPIAEATIDLRPLTVFVGPSNTGKTYFAILIYALHRVLGGFPRLPAVFHAAYVANNVVREELQNVLERLEETAERPLRLSDLPESMRSTAQAALHNPQGLGRDLNLKFRTYFDLDSVSGLVRFSSHPDSTKISLAASEEGRNLWHLHMGISESGITTDGHIKDMVILPAGWWDSESKPAQAFSQYRQALRESVSRWSRWYLFNELSFAAGGRGDTHYLPAARGGIMQSHRIIASSLMARATRAGLERFAELSTFSGVIADFTKRLIDYEEGRSDNFLSNHGIILMSKIANDLERETLAGQIRTQRPSGGYPEFVYRPLETEEDIRLTRASSMVSELAPVVLFLRGVVQRGDMFIIEEPEAHLHPAAQTWMAVALARLVRAGVRVVVTTHSDWLLKEIGNLIREGELKKRTGETASEGDLPSSLHPSEVGIWLFRKDDDSAGSVVKEIPFDRSEGVEPPDYEDVAEELYNRSADLQNRFEETTGEPERDGE